MSEAGRGPDDGRRRKDSRQPLGGGRQHGGRREHGGGRQHDGGRQHGGGRARRDARPARTNLARVLAWEVLRDVDLEDAYANLLLPGKLSRTRLGGPDAALATELAYGTLRWRGLYDAIITVAADRPAADIDVPVLAALRMGAHQILGMRVADHAAVSETVAVVKEKHEPRAGGFVNAVLRRITERSREEWVDEVTRTASEGSQNAAEAPADDVRRLEITTSHPAWIIRALRQALVAHGRDAAELPGLLDADNAPAAVCLSVLPGLADRDAIAESWGSRTAYSPIGVHLSHGAPSDVPEVARGTTRVQDEGSQLVALALTAPEAPEGAWLDMCAGPGDKTAVLGAVARGTGEAVIATDASEHRADLVEDSTRELADVVEVFAADGREFGRAHAEQFSRVLVDAPCSGLGALRRRPEARWRRSPADIGELGPVQRDLLAAAITAAMPGGLIAYTTCSPHHAETLQVVESVLDDLGRDATADAPAVEVLDAAAVLAGITGRPAEEFASATVGSGRCAQLWPDAHGTDGMFIALLRRR